MIAGYNINCFWHFSHLRFTKKEERCAINQVILPSYCKLGQLFYYLQQFEKPQAHCHYEIQNERTVPRSL